MDGLIAAYLRAYWRDDEASEGRAFEALVDEIGRKASVTVIRAIFILADEGRIPDRGALCDD